jgi:hypothetical protein
VGVLWETILDRRSRDPFSYHPQQQTLPTNAREDGSRSRYWSYRDLAFKLQGWDQRDSDPA